MKRENIGVKRISWLGLTHNSGPLHKVIRAGATRLSIKASFMPRRISCKPGRCKRETGASNTHAHMAQDLAGHGPRERGAEKGRELRFLDPRTRTRRGKHARGHMDRRGDV